MTKDAFDLVKMSTNCSCVMVIPAGTFEGLEAAVAILMSVCRFRADMGCPSCSAFKEMIDPDFSAVVYADRHHLLDQLKSDLHLAFRLNAL